MINITEIYSGYITSHVESVRRIGELMGVPSYQLMSHDQSKWHPFEFWPYARWIIGKEASTEAKESFDAAVLHHYRHNPHHWQYWVKVEQAHLRYSPYSAKVTTIPMPENFVLEMVADWIASEQRHSGSVDMTEWLLQNLPSLVLHKKTEDILTDILRDLGYSVTLQSMGFYGRHPDPDRFPKEVWRPE